MEKPIPKAINLTNVRQKTVIQAGKPACTEPLAALQSPRHDRKTPPKRPRRQQAAAPAVSCRLGRLHRPGSSAALLAAPTPFRTIFPNGNPIDRDLCLSLLMIVVFNGDCRNRRRREQLGAYRIDHSKRKCLVHFNLSIIKNCHRYRNLRATDRKLDRLS